MTAFFEMQLLAPADFCLLCNKIMLENPHTFLMKTGSKIYLRIMRYDHIINQ